jgi:hypothetical protein
MPTEHDKCLGRRFERDPRQREKRKVITIGNGESQRVIGGASSVSFGVNVLCNNFPMSKRTRVSPHCADGVKTLCITPTKALQLLAGGAFFYCNSSQNLLKITLCHYYDIQHDNMSQI